MLHYHISFGIALLYLLFLFNSFNTVYAQQKLCNENFSEILEFKQLSSSTVWNPSCKLCGRDTFSCSTSLQNNEDSDYNNITFSVPLSQKIQNADWISTSFIFSYGVLELSNLASIEVYLKPRNNHRNNSNYNVDDYYDSYSIDLSPSTSTFCGSCKSLSERIPQSLSSQQELGQKINGNSSVINLEITKVSGSDFCVAQANLHICRVLENQIGSDLEMLAYVSPSQKISDSNNIYKIDTDSQITFHVNLSNHGPNIVPQAVVDIQIPAVVHLDDITITKNNSDEFTVQVIDSRTYIYESSEDVPSKIDINSNPDGSQSPDVICVVSDTQQQPLEYQIRYWNIRCEFPNGLSVESTSILIEGEKMFTSGGEGDMEVLVFSQNEDWQIVYPSISTRKSIFSSRQLLFVPRIISIDITNTIISTSAYLDTSPIYTIEIPTISSRPLLPMQIFLKPSEWSDNEILINIYQNVNNAKTKNNDPLISHVIQNSDASFFGSNELLHMVIDLDQYNLNANDVAAATVQLARSNPNDDTHLIDYRIFSSVTRSTSLPLNSPVSKTVSVAYPLLFFDLEFPKRNNPRAQRTLEITVQEENSVVATYQLFIVQQEQFPLSFNDSSAMKLKPGTNDVYKKKIDDDSDNQSGDSISMTGMLLLKSCSTPKCRIQLKSSIRIFLPPENPVIQIDSLENKPSYSFEIKPTDEEPDNILRGAFNLDISSSSLTGYDDNDLVIMSSVFSRKDSNRIHSNVIDTIHNDNDIAEYTVPSTELELALQKPFDDNEVISVIAMNDYVSTSAISLSLSVSSLRQALSRVNPQEGPGEIVLVLSVKCVSVFESSLNSDISFQIQKPDNVDVVSEEQDISFSLDSPLNYQLYRIKSQEIGLLKMSFPNCVSTTICIGFDYISLSSSSNAVCIRQQPNDQSSSSSSPYSRYDGYEAFEFLVDKSSILMTPLQDFNPKEYNRTNSPSSSSSSSSGSSSNTGTVPIYITSFISSGATINSDSDPDSSNTAGFCSSPLSVSFKTPTRLKSLPLEQPSAFFSAGFNSSHLFHINLMDYVPSDFNPETDRNFPTVELEIELGQFNADSYDDDDDGGTLPGVLFRDDVTGFQNRGSLPTNYASTVSFSQRSRDYALLASFSYSFSSMSFDDADYYVWIRGTTLPSYQSDPTYISVHYVSGDQYLVDSVSIIWDSLAVTLVTSIGYSLVGFVLLTFLVLLIMGIYRQDSETSLGITAHGRGLAATTATPDKTEFILSFFLLLPAVIVAVSVLMNKEARPASKVKKNLLGGFLGGLLYSTIFAVLFGSLTALEDCRGTIECCSYGAFYPAANNAPHFHRFYDQPLNQSSFADSAQYLPPDFGNTSSRFVTTDQATVDCFGDIDVDFLIGSIASSYCVGNTAYSTCARRSGVFPIVAFAFHSAGLVIAAICGGLLFLDLVLKRIHYYRFAAHY